MDNLVMPENIKVSLVEESDGTFLGYMCNSIDAEAVKRITKWGNPKLGILDFSNIKINGLKLVEITRRLETDNVFFEVLDPRGFKLQISSDNLLDIIKAKGILVDGVFDGDYIWVLNNKKAYLMNYDNPIVENLSIKNTTKPFKVSLKNLNEGDKYLSSDGHSIIHYIGKFIKYESHRYEVLSREIFICTKNDKIVEYNSTDSKLQVLKFIGNEPIIDYSKYETDNIYNITSRNKIDFELDFIKNSDNRYPNYGKIIVAKKDNDYYFKLTDVEINIWFKFNFDMDYLIFYKGYFKDDLSKFYKALLENKVDKVSIEDIQQYDVVLRDKKNKSKKIYLYLYVR